jgi:hypothetical protein
MEYRVLIAEYMEFLMERVNWYGARPGKTLTRRPLEAFTRYTPLISTFPVSTYIITTVS